jgi:sporulation protein YlmC with PRC-barrel domain
MLKDYRTLVITVLAWVLIGFVGSWAINKFVNFEYKPPIDVKQYSVEAFKDVVILEPRKSHVELASLLSGETQKAPVSGEAIAISAQSKPQMEVSGLSVKMIVVSEAGNFAVVNDLLLKEGDMIQDFKVEKIRQEGLLLSRGGEQVWIK